MNKHHVIQQVSQQSIQVLEPLVSKSIEEAAAELSGSDSSVHFGTVLLAARKQICDRFAKYLSCGFDRLLGAEAQRIETGDYPGLSVVDDQFLEVANALEGMINYARNTNIKLLINLNTRLGELLVQPSVDETNSPLDPDRIAQAFVDALAPVALARQFELPVYRHFNRSVLRQLHGPLQRANELCIANGLLPELVVDGRSRASHLGRRSSSRPDNSPWERAFPLVSSEADESTTGSAAQLFRTIRGLLHGNASETESGYGDADGETEVVVPAAVLTGRQFTGSLFGEMGMLPLRARRDMQVADRDVILITRHQLLGILDQVQAGIIAEVNARAEVAADHRQFNRLLGDALLQSSVSGTINAIDGDSFDALLTISLLYESFCRDISLVKPVKELVLATQVVMMKIAIQDASLFQQRSHPARLLMNEVASAGVRGLDREQLREDPLYQQLEARLIRLIMEYDGDQTLLDGLLDEVIRFKQQHQDAASESIRAAASGAGECRKRLAQTHAYVTRKIRERVTVALHPVVDDLVNNHYHRFLVSVVQRDGQGSNSWILVIKILDLLLWTLKPEKKAGDFHRFQRCNTLLLRNLKKALLNTGVQAHECESLLAQLQEVQMASFDLRTDNDPLQRASATAGPGLGEVPSNRPHQDRPQSWQRSWQTRQMEQSLPNDTAAEQTTARPTATFGANPEALRALGPDAEKLLDQVDRLPIGSWLRFSGEGGQSLHCTLAARLHSMDKLIFVNSKGVKVVEKTRHGMALELKEGTVRIVTEWPLFERGLEAVIARLRDRQHVS